MTFSEYFVLFMIFFLFLLFLWWYWMYCLFHRYDTIALTSDAWTEIWYQWRHLCGWYDSNDGERQKRPIDEKVLEPIRQSSAGVRHSATAVQKEAASVPPQRHAAAYDCRLKLYLHRCRSCGTGKVLAGITKNPLWSLEFWNYWTIVKREHKFWNSQQIFRFQYPLQLKVSDAN